jgi:hypothetical protein
MDMDVFAPEFIRKSWPDLGMDSLCGPVPRWIDRAGDLVVVDSEVNWSTPECSDSGIDTYEMAPGTYPVYAGSFDLSDSVQVRYYVNTLFIAFASPEKIAESTWHVDESAALRIDGYACLWSRRAEQHTPFETLLGYRESMLSAETLSRRGPWINEVADLDSGANVMAFPVADNSVSGIEALDEDGELRALLYFTWSP